MKTQIVRTPKLRLHKATGQGFVELNGHRLYLGRYDLSATRENYHRTVAEWLSNGRVLPVAPDEITITEVAALYWTHAQSYYVHPTGKETATVSRVRRCLRPLVDLYGSSNASEFGPKALKALIQHWIDRGLARHTINDNIGEMKRLFKWAASNEYIPITTYQGLQTVDGLRRGRSAARETEPIKPVPLEDVEAVKPYVSRQVAAMIDIQLLTGARSGEVVGLRPIDIDTSSKPWTATLEHHKTAHRGRERTIYFGPDARAVLKPFMLRPEQAYLFSAKEAEVERAQAAPSHRREDQQPTLHKTKRTIGDRYTKDSYRRAIVRACEQANVPKWTPHRLRHNAATRIRKEFGLEAAQILLGHAQADVTQIYAEVDHAKAIAVAEEIG